MNKNIDVYLSQIESAATGREMRTAIHDAIRECYAQISSMSSGGGASAPTPPATETTPGTVLLNAEKGVGVLEGKLTLYGADISAIKAGTDNNRFAGLSRMPAATFYALARAAGDKTQAASANPVGEYTPKAKIAIRTMLGIEDELAALKSRVALLERRLADGNKKP